MMVSPLRLAGARFLFPASYPTWFDSRRVLRIFLFTTAVSRTALGPTQPPIQWEPGALSLRTKPGREADHSPPSSAEVKGAWSYTSTPQYAFMAWCSVKKHRDNFTFYTTLNISYDVRKGVGVAWLVWWLGCGLNYRGSVLARDNERILFSRHRVRTGSGATQPPVEWIAWS
jgi:hypothetical protein